MTERFADAAKRLAGASGVAFGWSPDAFWAATPDELAALFAALRPAGERPPATPEIDRLRELFPDG